MENSSVILSFVLAAYFNVGNVKYAYFFIIGILYCAIIFANMLLIGIIFLQRSLHEPMYVLLCNLCINELYGSTALFPSLMLNMLSDTHEISKTVCMIQIFCVYTYGCAEFCSLAIMSYDRYVSICNPLHYNNKMTPVKICTLMLLGWLYSFTVITIIVSLSMRLRLCGNTINKVYCDNYLLVRLSCSETTVNNIYGLLITVSSVIVPLILILFSYAKILSICLNSSREDQLKALSTCAPHLASLLNFSVGCCFEIIQSRFDMSHVRAEIRIILSLYFLMCPPLFNPIIYGLRMNKIKKAVKKVLS